MHTYITKKMWQHPIFPIYKISRVAVSRGRTHLYILPNDAPISHTDKILWVIISCQTMHQYLSTLVTVLRRA